MEEKFDKLSTRNFLLIWVVFVSLIRLINLGYSDLQPWDEGMYALRSKAALEFGAILDQTEYSVEGLYSSSHPPLIIWLTALVYSVFGINEYTSRFVIALFGILTIITIFFLVSKLYSYREGAFSAIILGTNTLFTEYTRLGQLDGPYVFFMSLSILGWYLWISKKSSPFGLLLIAFAFACALMSKLIVGFYIPLILIGLQFTINGFKWRNVFSKNLIVSLIIGLLIALPWRIWMAFRHGEQFFDTAFWFHLINRSIVAIEGEGKTLGIFYFINQIFVQFPEITFGLTYILVSVFKFKTSFIKDVKIAIPVVWTVVVFIIITGMETKMTKYILPLAVSATMLGGIGLCSILKNEYSSRTVLFIGSAGALAILWSNFYPIRSLLKENILGIPEINPYQYNSPIPYLWISFCIIGPFLLFIFKNSYNRFFVRKIFVLTFLLISTISSIYQVSNEYSTKFNLGTKQVCSFIQEKEFDELILISDVKNPAISFYLNGIEEGWYNDKRFSFIKVNFDEDSVKKILESKLNDKNRFIVFDKRELKRSKKFVIEEALPSKEYNIVFENQNYALYYKSN